MNHNRAKVILSILMYMFSSISNVFSNKYLMVGNINIILLIFLQHLSTFVFLYLFKSALKKFQNKTNEDGPPKNLTFIESFKKIWMLVLSFNLTLIFGNICLKHTPISTYQLARSLTLPLNFLFSLYFFKQIKFNGKMMLSCVIVSIGFFIFSFDNFNTNFHSVFYGSLVSVIQAIHLNLLKTKLNIFKDNVQMIYHNVIYSTLILLIYLTITRDIFAFFKLDAHSVFCLFISCLISVCLTLSSFMCIYYTDNVVFNMLGNVKSTIQTVLSKFYYTEDLNFNTFVGILLTTIGSFFYALSRERTMFKEKVEITEKRAIKKEEIKVE